MKLGEVQFLSLVLVDSCCKREGYIMKRELVTAFAILVVSSLASAETWTVALDENGDFTSIQEALNAAAEGDTITVEDGTYTGPLNRNLDFFGRAVVLRSASGPGECIIDCEGQSRGITFNDGETASTIVDGFRIVNGYVPGEGRGGGVYIELGSSPTIRNCIIENCAAYWGAGIMIHDQGSSPLIEWCEIRGNSFFWGGSSGIGVSGEAEAEIRHCVIVNNTTGWGPGILVDWNSFVRVTRSTIADNVALASGSARNVTAWHGATIELNSCIVWGGGDHQMSTNPLGPGTISATYSCIQGGFAGIGNISNDPVFLADGSYMLSEESPCIDAGDPSLPHDPDDTIADIGAYYFESTVLVEDPFEPDPEVLQYTTEVHKNYPNPFNPETSVAFEVEYAGPTLISIHDLRGRLVTTLLDEHLPAGRHEVTWDGRDASGREVPSGVYLSRLEAVGQMAHGRMSLVR